ncbi:MAG: carbon starvation protein A [Pyrinomonas sp.]|uniref:carbon starvation CstA family protein n=1 Tax=Pyrinomonas sp. TaxID=2080306 RepID=UPI003320958D
MRKVLSILLWATISALGALAFAILALNNGETISAAWLIIAAVATYAVAYRFYSKFIANRALGVDDRRATPAELHNDGKDFVPTNKWVLLGHHFAAIAGAGPLVGPILAAQMGYLPGTLWIIIGVVLGGAVQDFVILFLSMRRDGRSLGQIVRDEIGPASGLLALIGIPAIMVILIAVLALVVVNALRGSPWGTFTIAMTIPIALLMGVYMRHLRPGRVLEGSLIGFALLLFSLWLGQRVAEHPYWASLFTLSGTTLAQLMILYGFTASILPVWLLLAPRDYLSSFLKVGTVLLLAIGILVVLPPIHMPKLTRFVDGTGPVFKGDLFPFLFITIACGAISGFHSLIASGTTPKMIQRESQARMIGYGAMLMESFVAVMAMVAAASLTPGIYFAMNSPAAAIGTDAATAAAKISQWGFAIDAQTITQWAKDVGEQTILSRTGGAPTLAVGIADTFSKFMGGFKAFWYHFAILFEAVFILTTIDAGTRVGRFMLQDLLGNIWRPLGRTESFGANALASAIIAATWGYFLYQGVTDPLGGINTLWPLFGIANQMLAGIALSAATVVLVKMGRARYSWVTAVPLAWLLAVTLTAGWQKLFSADPTIGFLAHARLVADGIASDHLIAPAKSLADMEKMLFNDRVDALMTATLILVIVGVFLDAVRICYQVLVVKRKPELKEAPFVLSSNFQS